MKSENLWTLYMQGISPAEFMAASDAESPAVRVDEFLREQRPSLYGIVRRGTWQETFAAGKTQYTRDVVGAALITHLEETRSEWEAKAAEARRQRAETRKTPPPPAQPEAEAPAAAEEMPTADGAAEANFDLPPMLDGLEEAVEIVGESPIPADMEEDGLPPETELESEWPNA